MIDPFKKIQLTPDEEALLRRAGTLLAAFTIVTLFAGFISMNIMEKRLPMIVPKVIGMDQAQAEKALSTKGLRLKVGRTIFDDKVPAGLISAQDPKANGYVKRGETVEITLSKGSPKVKVPAVSSLSLAEAQINLSGVHLRAGRQTLISSAESRNTVLGQFPDPDELVESASEVDLLISAGPTSPSFIMPDLQYQPLEKVFKTLRPAGINIEKITREVHDDLDSETVITQNPLPGTNIQNKDSVSFVVSAKSSDSSLKARYSKIVFDMPLGNPKRLQIDVFDNTGTRTIYNKMESPRSHVETGASVTGKAFAEIYLNQQFVEELPID